jgi:[acyl-carrier-protein] S-malonyltransferase
MAAILGLDVAAVESTCREAAAVTSQVVESVNFNGPEQIVIAGHKEAVERAIALATERGAKRGVLLPVSAPFHSSLIRPAVERLASKLAGVSLESPSIPVLHNVDVAERREPDAIRVALAQQAASPVRWVETIEAFAARGVTHVVECGPGRVLTGLNKRIVRELKSFALTDGADLDAARAALTA